MRYADPEFSYARSWIPACAGMTGVLGVLLLPIPAAAFDCAKAGTAVEKAICQDPAAKRLDDELGTVYGQLRGTLAEPEQKMLAMSQKRWIARREFCSAQEDVTSCARELTAERLALLEGQPLSGPGGGGRLVPQFLVQDGSATQYDIDIAVMRFAEPKTPGELTLNRLADEVLATVKLGPHGAPEQSAILAREDRFSLTYASPAFLSVRHDFYANEGGAHGNYGTSNHNIDMASGRLLSIAEVLAEPSAAILTLWCKAQIEAEKQKRIPGIDLAEAAADRDRTIAAQVRDLASWSIGESEIVVSFDPYAVGAYAEGAYQCRFPTAGVRELTLEGAPFP
jgi:uncharacterized protein YecT (DUF1311 family)